MPYAVGIKVNDAHAGTLEIHKALTAQRAMMLAFRRTAQGEAA